MFRCPARHTTTPLTDTECVAQTVQYMTSLSAPIVSELCVCVCSETVTRTRDVSGFYVTRTPPFQHFARAHSARNALMFQTFFFCVCCPHPRLLRVHHWAHTRTHTRTTSFSSTRSVPFTPFAAKCLVGVSLVVEEVLATRARRRLACRPCLFCVHKKKKTPGGDAHLERDIMCFGVFIFCIFFPHCGPDVVSSPNTSSPFGGVHGVSSPTCAQTR